MAGYIAYEEIDSTLSNTHELTSSTFGRSNGATIYVRNGELKVRFDGTIPGDGQPISGPATITLTSADQLQRFRFSGNARLYAHYFVGDNLFAADIKEQAIVSGGGVEKFDELIRLTRVMIRGLSQIVDDGELLAESERN